MKSYNKEQENIYNQYLKALAKVNQRPYKPRKDFSKIDEETEIALHRLELFFQQFKHISPYSFFIALLEVKDLKYAKLSDYLHHKAIAAYSKHINLKYDEYVDSEKSIEDFIEGIKFIVGFCIENKLPTDQYKIAVNNSGVPLVLVHLNEQKISYYHLHALDISRTQLKTDYIEILFSDFDKKFTETKRKYITSTKLKELGNKIGKKLNNQ